MIKNCYPEQIYFMSEVSRYLFVLGFFIPIQNIGMKNDMFLEYRHTKLVSVSVSFILRFRNKFGMTNSNIR